jgi:hypothetical protein
MRQRPTFWLVLAVFALLLGAQVFIRSLGAGMQAALVRGSVVTLAVGLIGAAFVHLVERDLRSRLEDAPATSQASSAPDRLVLRPTPWKVWYYLTLPTIVVGVSLAFVWAAAGNAGSGNTGAWACFAFSLVFTPIFIGGAWLFVHNARLELTGDSLTKTNWRGASSRVSRSAIVRVLRLAVDRSGTSYRGTWVARYWVFDSAEGRALVIASQAMWPLADMEILVGRLGVPVEGSWNEVLKPKEARRQVEGVVRWTTAHPWFVLISAVVLTFVLIILLIQLLSPNG